MDGVVVDDESMLLQDPVHSDEVKLRQFIVPSPTDFGAWTSLIAEVEKTSPVDVEKLCLVYDSFLSLFPLCYGYWKNYAGHMAHLCNVDKVVEVYERALQFTTYSVHLWVDYCTFAMLLFEDPMDVRRLFERGISFVGKDYLCHLLWDKYIEFEYSQKQWSSLAHIYVRTLKFPTKNLNSYYSSFKKLATIWEEEAEFQNTGKPKVQSEDTSNAKISNLTASEDEDLLAVIRELIDPAFGLRRRNALHKFLFIGEQFYLKASQIKAQIHCFESRIRRPYFHVKPLDVSQLENWHCYLDFVEMRGDFDWTVKLYERCLIPCANYPEFWVRYVEIMESKGGREIAKFALARATEIFLKNVPVIHLFNARFKEKIGDVSGAHAAFHKLGSELDSDLIENVRREAHMEKRLGNSEAALNMYEKALEMAKERENSHTLSILYIHFCRFKYMVTGCIDSARDIIIKGIQNLPNCKLLLEGLMNFEMTHRGPWKIHVIESVVTHAISPGLDIPPGFSLKDREDISNLFLEFVDQCGTIDDIRKAWDRHRKLFPHLMTATSYNCTAERQDILITLPHHASGGNSDDGSIQQSLREQKLPLPEKPDSQSDHAITDECQSEGINGTKQISQPLESPNVAVNSGQNAAEENAGGSELMLESPNVVEHSGQNATEENAGGCELMLETPNVVEHSGQNATEENAGGSELMLETPNVVEHSGQNATEENAGGIELMDEVVNHSEAAKSSQEYCEKVSEAQKTPDCEPNNDIMRPPSLESLSLNSQGNEARHSSPITSHDCEGSQATPRSHESKPQNSGYSNSNCSPSSARCIESGNSAQVHVPADSALLHSASDPTTQQSPVVPTTSVSDPSAVREGNWYHMNSSGQTPGDASSGFQGYPQSQHPQQWQIAPQQQYQSSVVQPQMIVHQVYPSQPQFGQNPQMQPGVQAQNHYQVPAAQVQQVSGHALPAGNMQQQNFPSTSQPQTSSQPVSYPQAQFYQYPPQGNEHYGHMRNSQGYTPQMWHYYYLQQQQQQQQLQQQQQQLQQSQQLLLLQQQQQQQQSQLHNQLITPSQIRTWSNSYYQQVQVAQGQGAALVISDASGPAVYQSPPPQPPTN